MYFTQEDYRKIEAWLQTRTVKDTQFVQADPIKGDELIPIVQDDRNKTTSFYNLVKAVTEVEPYDFYNITAKLKLYKISLIKAVNSIPVEQRKCGLVITFYDENERWNIYQFRGDSVNQWQSLDYWENIITSTIKKYIDDNLYFPDEEDITAYRDANRWFIKFKDRIPDVDEFVSTGTIILRKNIMGIDECNLEGDTPPINVLTQDMVTKENVIYVVQYDFDLQGKTINIPQGSTLWFQGGSLNNGNVILNDTAVLGVYEFSDIGDVALYGTFNTGEILTFSDDSYKRKTGGYFKRADKLINSTDELIESYDVNPDAYTTSTRQELRWWNGEEWIRVLDITDYDEIKSIIQDLINKHNLEMTAVYNKISDIYSEISDIKQDINGIKQDITEIRQDITQIKSDIASINNKIEQIETTISALQTTVNNLISEFNNFKTEVEQKFGDVYNTINNFKNEVNDKFTQIDNKFDQTDDKISNLETTVNNFKSDVTNNFNTINNKVEELENNISNLEVNIDNRFENFENEVNNRFEQVDNSITNIDNSITNIEGSITDIKNSIVEIGDTITIVGSLGNIGVRDNTITGVIIMPDSIYVPSGPNPPDVPTPSGPIVQFSAQTETNIIIHNDTGTPVTLSAVRVIWELPVTLETYSNITSDLETGEFIEDSSSLINKQFPHLVSSINDVNNNALLNIPYQSGTMLKCIPGAPRLIQATAYLDVEGIQKEFTVDNLHFEQTEIKGVVRHYTFGEPDFNTLILNVANVVIAGEVTFTEATPGPDEPNPPVTYYPTVQFNAYAEAEVDIINDTDKIVELQYVSVDWTLPATLTNVSGEGSTHTIDIELSRRSSESTTSNRITYPTLYSPESTITCTPGSAAVSNVTAHVIVKSSESDPGLWRHIDVMNVTEIDEDFTEQSYGPSDGKFNTALRDLGTITVKGNTTYYDDSQNTGSGGGGGGNNSSDDDGPEIKFEVDLINDIEIVNNSNWIMGDINSTNTTWSATATVDAYKRNGDGTAGELISTKDKYLNGNYSNGNSISCKVQVPKNSIVECTLGEITLTSGKSDVTIYQTEGSQGMHVYLNVEYDDYDDNTSTATVDTKSISSNETINLGSVTAHGTITYNPG